MMIPTLHQGKVHILIGTVPQPPITLFHPEEHMKIELYELTPIKKTPLGKYQCVEEGNIMHCGPLKTIKKRRTTTYEYGQWKTIIDNKNHTIAFTDTGKYPTKISRFIITYASTLGRKYVNGVPQSLMVKRKEKTKINKREYPIGRSHTKHIYLLPHEELLLIAGKYIIIVSDEYSEIWTKDRNYLIKTGYLPLIIEALKNSTISPELLEDFQLTKQENL